MKKLIYTVSFAILLGGILSCEDFLDRKPYGQVTMEDIGSETILGGLVYGIYSHLKDYDVGVFPFIGLACIPSDDSDKGSSATDSPEMIQMDNFTFNAANSLIKQYYEGNFSGISKCNLALENLKTSPGDQDSKNEIEAEVRFLRGVLYFNLVRSYGGVPIVDQVLDQSAQTPPRATIQQTYNFIEQDLLFAIQYLPLKSTWGETWAGRATIGAAQGYLAKVYLYQKRWSDVLPLTSAIIASNQYNLSTPYGKIFTEAQENGSESVFEAQCQSKTNIDGISSQFAEVQGVRGPLDYGWGFNIPSKKLLEAYEEGDPRENATVIVRGQVMEDGVLIPTGSTNPYYNKKVYQWADEIATHPERPFGGWINIRLMRYSDVILMHAEAANEVGGANNIADALKKLEMVRSRARGGDKNVLPEVTTTNQDDLRRAIQHERRIEFAMEFERYYDLLRWGLAETVLAPRWKVGKNELFPIPQSEIDKSNGIITQNPGY